MQLFSIKWKRRFGKGLCDSYNYCKRTPFKNLNEKLFALSAITKWMREFPIPIRSKPTTELLFGIWKCPQYHRELPISSLHVLECSFHKGLDKCEHAMWHILEEFSNLCWNREPFTVSRATHLYIITP